MVRDGYRMAVYIRVLFVNQIFPTKGKESDVKFLIFYDCRERYKNQST